MKKFFLIISVALGAVIPFGKASAGPICTNTYVDGSTETSLSSGSTVSGSYNNLTSLRCKCKNPSNKKIKNSVCTYQNAKSELEFDTNGNETKYIFSNCSGGTCNITETTKRTYDENGRKTDENCVRKDGNGNITETIDSNWVYDENGHNTDENYVRKDGNGNITEAYDSNSVYDENGRKTNENYVRKDGNGNITETYDSNSVYNENGNLTEHSYEYKDGDGNVVEYGTDEYDDGHTIHREYVKQKYYENGQISHYIYDGYAVDERGNGTDYEYIEKEYYENGQLKNEYEGYNYQDGTSNSSTKEYYENGRLSQTKVSVMDENGIDTENSVTYDENGNITSERNHIYNSDHTETQDNMYYEYDDDGKLISRTNEICNNRRCSSVSYDANGDLLSVNGNEVTENCASADSNGVCTKCKDGFDDIDGYCNKIRWTPAEAAKVLRDDNTNEVTITFKK